jgi:hypothetical protein
MGEKGGRMADFLRMTIRSTRIPHGNGWYSFVRGAMISRRQALHVLIFGPERARIESWQSNDPEWPQ